MKRFYKWIGVKKDLHECETLRTVKRGEVWWCGMGENVGVEINGKGDRFARPVLVLRKLSVFGFIGIPLTSQPHSGSWYAHFSFRNKEQYAALAQMRTLSAKRLYRKIGMIDDGDFRMVVEQLRNFLFE